MATNQIVTGQARTPSTRRLLASITVDAESVLNRTAQPQADFPDRIGGRSVPLVRALKENGKRSSGNGCGCGHK